MKTIVLSVLMAISLSGCVTRARYLDYGADCRASGFRSGVIKGINDSQEEVNHLKQVIAVSEGERMDIAGRLSRCNYQLEKCKKGKK